MNAVYVLLVIIAIISLYLGSPKADPKETTDVREFMKWIKDRATIAPIAIVEFSGMGRGLIATDNIPENGTLLETSIENVIYPANVLKWVPIEERERFIILRDDLLVAAYLIQERIKGNASRWFEWINILPKRPTILSSFYQKNIDAFEDPSLIHLVHQQRQEYFQTFYSFSKHLCPYFLTISASWSDRLWACSYSGFLWSYSIVLTRSVSSHHLLIPLLDFRNFISTDSPYDSVDRSQDLTHHLDIEEGKVRVITNKAVKVGRQVYLDYESDPSHVYLLHHGFVPISNIHDCLLISLPSPTPSPSSLLSRVLLALSYPSTDSMCLDITRYMNDRQLAYFLLRDATEQQLEQCIDYYETTVQIREGSSWEAAEVRRCALGVWTDDSKAVWDSVKDELKRQLVSHLHSINNIWSKSIATDHIDYHKNKNHWSNEQLIAYQWRINRKHLLHLLLSHLSIQQIEPHEKQQTQQLDEPLLSINDWVKQHSDHVSISIASTPWGGHRLLAKHEIQQGEEVLRINETAVFSIQSVINHPKFGTFFVPYLEAGMKEDLVMKTTLLWEQFDNDRWSDFAPFLRLLPPLSRIDHPILLPHDTALALFGSHLHNQLQLLNSTIRTDFALVQGMLRSHTVLRKEFITSKLFTFDRFLWSYLIVESMSVFCEGRQVILPPLAFGQNSMFQEVGEYLDVRHEGSQYVVIAGDTTRLTNDFVIKQGFPNWYSYLFRGQLLLATKGDCVLWTLELSTDDVDYDMKMKILNEKGFHSYEQFCLQGDATRLPEDFITILSILRGEEPKSMKEKREMILAAIKERINEYITLTISDRRRSRRGQYSDKLTTIVRFIMSEKLLLKELSKSLRKGDLVSNE